MEDVETEKRRSIDMPFIHSNVSVKMTPEQREQLKAAFGKAISIFNGKSEHGLMLRFSDECQMYHRGISYPGIACVQVHLFGKQPEEKYLKFTKEVCGFYEQILQIPAEHVDIIYETAAAWGSDFRNS